MLIYLKIPRPLIPTKVVQDFQSPPSSKAEPTDLKPCGIPAGEDHLVALNRTAKDQLKFKNRIQRPRKDPRIKN